MTRSNIMPKRYFEFVNGRSAKFWEIGNRGTDVMVRFGRIGTNGQTQVKTLPNAAEAERRVAKLVAQKLAKGYELVAS
jgi:predicted DNA-binding WGR domain protein